MRISDWSSDVCSSDLRFRKGRFYRRHHASCDGIEVRQNDRGSVVGGEIGMMTAKAADQERANSPDITLRSVRHQPGKRLAIGLFRLNQRVEVEVENELASITQFERRFAFQTVHET